MGYLSLERMLTTKEVAELLGLHPNTVKRMADHELASVRVSSRGDRRFPASDVAAFIEKRKTEAWR